MFLPSRSSCSENQIQNVALFSFVTPSSSIRLCLLFGCLDRFSPTWCAAVLSSLATLLKHHQPIVSQSLFSFLLSSAKPSPAEIPTRSFHFSFVHCIYFHRSGLIALVTSRLTRPLTVRRILLSSSSLSIDRVQPGCFSFLLAFLPVFLSSCVPQKEKNPLYIVCKRNRYPFLSFPLFINGLPHDSFFH